MKSGAKGVAHHSLADQCVTNDLAKMSVSSIGGLLDRPNGNEALCNGADEI